MDKLDPLAMAAVLAEDAKNFGQRVNFSACEIEHDRFRALFAGIFCPKMQNGRTSPKGKKN
jgi:hypothetical protein